MHGGARIAAVLALAAPALAGCGGGPPPMQCPQVVNYSDAQLDAIQAAINRLAKDDPLRGAMKDYEQLRDDSRYCVNLQKEEGR
jgi:hypothetical protein